MEYTKGEWKVSQHPDHKNYPFVHSDTGDVIAEVFADGVKCRDNNANAHLIAAAPEMYEALKAARWVLREHPIRHGIDKALAKAEGK